MVLYNLIVFCEKSILENSADPARFLHLPHIENAQTERTKMNVAATGETLSVVCAD